MSQERRAPIADVLSGREVRFIRPRVVEISERHNDLRLSFAQPGTMALLVASGHGAAELDRLVEAVERENFEEVELIHSRVAHQFADFVLDDDWTIDAYYRIPVFVSFRYAGKSLRRGMFAHGKLPVAHSLALYNGAALDHRHFTALEHRARGSREEVHAVVVVRKPRLTEVERHLIARIPEEVAAEVSLGEEYGFWTGVVVAQVVGNIGQRIINRAADELGVGDQVRAVEGVITAPVEVAQGVAQAGVQAVEGLVNAGLDAIGLGKVAADVEGAVGQAVDGVVNAIVDAIGDAVHWVAQNILTLDNAQGNQAAGAQLDANQQGADQQQQADDAQADDQADQGAGDQQDQQQAEGSSWQSWVDQVEQVAKQAEEVGAAVAVRELLQLRAQMIAANRVRVRAPQGRTERRGR